MKPLTIKPSLSISYMMYMAALPKMTREKAQKEWDNNDLV